MDLDWDGHRVITGNYVASISNYVTAARLPPMAARGRGAYGYDSGANKTTIQVAPPRQSLTGVAVSAVATRRSPTKQRRDTSITL